MEAVDIKDNADSPVVQARSKKMLLYIGIFSIVMLFAGLTSAYVVSQSDGFWVKISMPAGFYYSSAIILLSSGTLFLAKTMAKKGRSPLALIVVTLVLGILFSVLQFQAWNQLTESGNYFIGNFTDLKGVHGEDYTFIYKGEALKEVDGEFYQQNDALLENPLKNKVIGSRNNASSYIYVLSAVHLAHLFGGLIYLLVVIFRFLLRPESPKNLLKLELCGTYWHFLDGLWIYLFLFLLFIH